MSIDISKDIKEILDDYAIQVSKEVDKASDATAKNVTKDLRASSPKKSGKYGKSWSKKEDKGTVLNKNFIVYNKEHYRLTHLLEYGHATVNGGRVPPRPHIKQAEERGIQFFEKEVRKMINGK